MNLSKKYFYDAQPLLKEHIVTQNSIVISNVDIEYVFQTFIIFNS